MKEIIDLKEQFKKEKIEAKKLKQKTLKQKTLKTRILKFVTKIICRIYELDL